MKYFLFLFLATCFIIISITDDSYAFRCGSEIVGRWDSAASVEVKCGYPFRKEFVHEKINGRLEYVEKWFYNCGENDFVYSVTILNSIVVFVDSVARGKGKSGCKAN